MKGEEATAISAFKRGLDAPNTHLTSNTYLVGHSFTVVGYPHAVCDFNLGFYTPLINQPNFKKVVVGDGLKLTELMPSDAVGSLKLMEKAKVVIAFVLYLYLPFTVKLCIVILGFCLLLK